MISWATFQYFLDFGIPLLLLLAGLWALRLALRKYRRKPHPRCFACDYDMHMAASLTCPECGHTTQTQKQLLHGRINRSRLLLAILLSTPALLIAAIILYTALPAPASQEQRLAALSGWVEPGGQAIFLHLPASPPRRQSLLPRPNALAHWTMERAFQLWGITNPQQLWGSPRTQFTPSHTTLYQAHVDDQLSASNLDFTTRNPYGFAFARYIIHMLLRPLDHYERYYFFTTPPSFFFSRGGLQLDFGQLPLDAAQPELQRQRGTLLDLTQDLPGVQTITFNDGLGKGLKLPPPSTFQALAALRGVTNLNVQFHPLTPDQIRFFTVNPSIANIQWWADPDVFEKFDQHLDVIASFPALTTLNLHCMMWSSNRKIVFRTSCISDPTLAKLLSHRTLRETNIDCPIVPAQYPLTIAALKARTKPLKCKIAFILSDEDITPDLKALADKYNIEIRPTIYIPNPQKP
jgi:hypothetical protein